MRPISFDDLVRAHAVILAERAARAKAEALAAARQPHKLEVVRSKVVTLSV